MASESFEAGVAALRSGDWEEALAKFQNDLLHGESPEAWELAGTASCNLDDGAFTIHARERAFDLYAREGREKEATRLAIWLSFDYAAFRNEARVAAGWLQHAERMLAGIESCREQALARCARGYEALVEQRNPSAALKLARESGEMGQALGDLEVTHFSRALEGLTRVTLGEVQPGMRLLGEATAAATAGAIENLNLAWAAYCFMVSACERVRDYGQGIYWSGQVKAFCARWRLRSCFAICRTQCASLLVQVGAWREAELELVESVKELAQTRPALVPACTIRLAELRRRQGRWEEAESLFREVPTHVLSILGTACLSLDRGDARAAADLARRFLRRFTPEDIVERVPALELLVRAHVALGQAHAGSEALAELTTIANAIDTAPLHAAVSFARGVLTAAAGQFEDAQRYLEDAVAGYTNVPMPFDAGRAGTELARVLLGLESERRAREEARRAFDVLDRIGASWEAERARLLLMEIEHGVQATTSNDRPGEAELTPREREILALIAAGMSNREIADAMFLSVRTVERHVSNLYLKIGASGRAARATAAAYAVSRGAGAIEPLSE